MSLRRLLTRALQARHVRSAGDGASTRRFRYSVNDQRGASGARAGGGAQVHRAAEERERRAAAQKSIKTLAVIGPNADNVEVLLGNYNGEPTAPVTPLDGIRSANWVTRTKIIYAQGSDLADEHADHGDRPGVGAVHERWRATAARAEGGVLQHGGASMDRCYRAAGLTYPTASGGPDSAIQAGLDAHRPAGRFQVVGRRAARRT